MLVISSGLVITLSAHGVELLLEHQSIWSLSNESVARTTARLRATTASNGDVVIVRINPFTLLDLLADIESSINPVIVSLGLRRGVGLLKVRRIVRLTVGVVTVLGIEWVELILKQIRPIFVVNGGIDGSQRVDRVSRVRVDEHQTIRGGQPIVSIAAVVTLGELVRSLAVGWPRLGDGLIERRRRPAAAMTEENNLVHVLSSEEHT